MPITFTSIRASRASEGRFKGLGGVVYGDGFVYPGTIGKQAEAAGYQWGVWCGLCFGIG
jgi:hypothetical protein